MKNILLTLFLILLGACSSGSRTVTYSINTSGWGSNSNTGFYLTDAPPQGSTYKSINITVTKMSVHTSGSAAESAAGWRDVTLTTPLTVNLLDYQNTKNIFLTSDQLPLGVYQQIRLFLSDANVVVTSNGTDTTYPLTIPSGAQTGLKLVNLNLTLDGKSKIAIMLDFNADKSIVYENGSYKLKPVLKVLTGPVSSDGTSVIATDVGTAQ